MSIDPASLSGAVLACLQDVSDDAIIVTDVDGVVLTWSPGAARLYGFTPGEMTGRSLGVLWPDAQAPQFPEHLKQVRAGQRVEHFEAIRKGKDGRLLPVAVTLSPIREAGQVVAVLSVARDIRSQKRSEEALQASQARWRALLDSAVDGIIVIDARGRIEAFNAAAERLFGYAEREVAGRNVNILMPSPDHEQHDGYLSRYQREGQARIIGIGRDVIGRRRDGSTFPLHLSVGEMALEGERKFTGILHDLSARAVLEAQLRTSEARWRAVIESAVDGIVVIDARGQIEGFNPAAERLFGFTEAELLGRNVNVLMPSPYHDEHDGYLARYLREGAPRIIGLGREVTGLRKDGTTFPVHLSVGEMVVGGQRKFTGILHDLSGRVRMEEQLREQAALARLGEMAAVIAHEVKNPLAGIRGAVQVIGRRLPAGGPEAGVTEEIVTRIDALSELMKDLLLFARPPQPKPESMAIRPLVAATADLLNTDPALADVEVAIDDDGSRPQVTADAGLLKIVFVNLLVNSAQAMKGQGKITISFATADNTCSIVVRDTGPGIPPEVLERIFTPFFTTKSRGTGLGLPTAKRLIEAHHGNIGVDCSPGGGTEVTVQLPLARS